MKMKQNCLKDGIKSLGQETYNVTYDIADLQVLSVDGVLADLNKEEGRLLFFYNLSSVETEDNGEGNQNMINKCLVELRMSKSTFMQIADAIARKLLSFVSEEKPITSNEFIKKDAPQTMFA